MLRKFPKVHIFCVILLLFSINAMHAEEKSIELKTVIIDAGHGGKDAGTVRGKVYEKNITLSVALELGKLIKKEHPDVKIIYTRSSDKFVGLHERAEIANRNHGDLFISIHVNSVNNSRINGVETFVMGTERNASNMEICRKENAVITLEDDYSTNYSGFDPDKPESYIIFSLLQNAHIEQSLILAEMVQNKLLTGPIKYNRGVKQDLFLVLWKCAMPSVLVELGFLTNNHDYKVLTDPNSRKVIARKLADAFTQYKKQYDRKLGTEVPEGNQKNVKYKIQIFASGKLLPADSEEFKGYGRDYIKSGKYYKYLVGAYSTREEAEKALPNVRKKFKNAYIIELQ